MLGGVTMAFQAFLVKAIWFGGIAGYEYIRRHVLDYDGGRRGKAMTANMTKLTNTGKASKPDKVINLDVPGESRVIGKGAVIAYKTVMGYMGISHYPVIIAYDGLAVTA